MPRLLLNFFARSCLSKTEGEIKKIGSDDIYRIVIVN